MFFRRSIRWKVRLFLAVVAVVAASRAFATEQEMKIINARAQEIAPMLADAPNYGARIADRAFWDELAAMPMGKRTIQAAEGALKQPIPDQPEALYKEYYKNGNRSRYQNAFFKTTDRVDKFAIAEMLENKGRFVKPLEETLQFLCDAPSWVLPAHDSGAEVYDGKCVYSDLGATLTGGEIAIAVNLLSDKLSPEIVARAKAEVERRLLAPYDAAVKDKPTRGMWWIRTTNNWNAVCQNGTIAAALNVVDSKERRAFYVAAAEYFSEKYFMQGFTNDGYCSEGMGYWNYGYGNYVELAARVRVETANQVDFFRFPKNRAVVDYAPTLEIDKDNFAVFADCSPTARPSALYVGYVSRVKNYGYADYEERGLGEHIGLGDLIPTTSIAFDREIAFAKDAVKAEKFVAPARTVFPDAGVWICRPSADATDRYFAVAFKGGNNNELHNHNDLGSYSLILGSNSKEAPKASVYVSRDPGGETYTARTFGAHRYDGQLLNSFGHPVPRIAGVLQSPGANARAVVLNESLTDALDQVELDLTSAYNVPTLKSIRRAFEYKRATGADSGYFEIRDSVSFKDGAEEEFETAIVTFEKPENVAVETTENGAVVKAVGAVVRVDAKDAEGKALKIVAEKQIVGEKDESVPTKPTRVALKIDGKTNGATITQRFEVE